MLLTVYEASDATSTIIAEWIVSSQSVAAEDLILFSAIDWVSTIKDYRGADCGNTPYDCQRFQFHFYKAPRGAFNLLFPSSAK